MKYLGVLTKQKSISTGRHEPASDTANPKDVVSELKERYDEGKVTDRSELW